MAFQNAHANMSMLLGKFPLGLKELRWVTFASYAISRVEFGAL